MHTTLYLTGDEQKLFEALPAETKEGWTVSEVKLAMEDDRTIAVRAHMAEFDDPSLRSAAEALATAKTTKDFERVAGMVDFREYTPEQIAELFFALGVRTMTGFVGYLLLTAKDDEAIEAVAVISHIRDLLSQTNSEPLP